jgi:hypothetical protein
VVHGAVLAFPNNGRASKYDCEHGDVVDDGHHRGKPCRRDVGVELYSHGEIDSLRRRCFGTRQEITDLIGDDLLNVAGSEPCLNQCGRINVDLDCRLPARTHVPLEIRGNIKHECVFSHVHQWDDIALADWMGRLEIRRQKRASDAAGQLGIILVNHRNRRIVHFLRIAQRLGNYRERKSVDDEPKQNKIAQETAQLFGAEPEDVRQVAHGTIL